MNFDDPDQFSDTYEEDLDRIIANLRVEVPISRRSTMGL